MSESTIAELRDEIQPMLRETLHGREIDTMKVGMPELPHMLGIVDMDDVVSPTDEYGTILDSDHQFWDGYYESVETRHAVTEEVETAIHSMKEDDTLRITQPYGEDAGIMYIEVDELDRAGEFECPTCGQVIRLEVPDDDG